MNIRIYNAKILTMVDNYRVIEGEVWIRGTRIVYIGSNTPQDRNTCIKQQESWDREINAKGNMLMPGFKNAHTHSAMTFLRSYADDMPLQDWLTKQVFPMEARLTEVDIVLFSKLAIMEYLTSGITANFDMYLSPKAIAKASQETGFRTVIVGGLNDFVLSLDEVEEYYNRYNKQGEFPENLVRYQLGFHAEYTTSRPLLEGLARLSHKYQAPVYTHNSETKQEIEACIERTGMTPTVYLDSLGLFEYGGGGYHCNYMSESDLQIFKNKGLSVVTNPGSNLKLASGIAPIQKMLNMGINLAIGTDGPASNNCLDMFREMFLVTGLAKYREMDAAAIDANQVLYMATVGGAKAMGLDECDTLEVGKYADLIMIDLQQPNMQPIHNITKNLVYSGSKQNVKMTMVNGKILYEDGKFNIGVEPLELYAQIEERIEKIKSM